MGLILEGKRIFAIGGSHLQPRGVANNAAQYTPGHYITYVAVKLFKHIFCNTLLGIEPFFTHIHTTAC